MPLRAVLFDAGNTLLFLDHPRMAAAVGAALDMPLTGPALAAGGSAATRAMEGPRVDDRARATAYLEALFLEAGVPVAPYIILGDEELDVSAADSHRCRLHSLLVLRLPALELCPEEPLVAPDRLIEVRDRDPEVVNALHKAMLSVLAAHARQPA